MNRLLLVLFVLVVAVAPMFAVAQTRLPAITNLGDWNENTPILMINNPDDSGTSFGYCYVDYSHQRTSANIRVFVGYAADDPFEGYPITQLNDQSWRLEFYEVSGNFTYCGQDVEDSLVLTQGIFDTYGPCPDGIYQITMTLEAGGSGSAKVKLWYASDPPIECELGTMNFISTDINGDDHTDLSDVPLFTTLFQSGTYQKAIDFQYDGQTNLSDLPYFADRVGTGCR